MAVVNRIPAAPKLPRGTGLNVQVEVDPFVTQRMLSYTMSAVSGPSLARFLEEDAHEYFREEIERRFASEGDRKSGAWAPLHDATVDIRRALGYPGSSPINRRTDELYDFVTTSNDISAGSDWAQMDLPGTPPNEVVRQKLETAQRGSDNNPLGYGPTTTRPVLAVDQTDMAELLIALEAHIIYEVIGRIGD